jgi:uncharacterized membrane protein
VLSRKVGIRDGVKSYNELEAEFVVSAEWNTRARLTSWLGGNGAEMQTAQLVVGIALLVLGVVYFLRRDRLAAEVRGAFALLAGAALLLAGVMLVLLGISWDPASPRYFACWAAHTDGVPRRRWLDVAPCDG